LFPCSLSCAVNLGLCRSDFFNETVIRIFSRNQELIKTASKALPVFSLSFIPMALNLIYTSLLYSTKRTKQSDIIAICRGIAVKAIAIFRIPVILGSKMIWSAPLAAESITLSIAVIPTNYF
jgi:Na+-driven multidrug efflux pump